MQLKPLVRDPIIKKDKVSRKRSTTAKTVTTMIVEKHGTLMVRVNKKYYALTSQSFSPRGGFQMYTLPSHTMFESYTSFMCYSDTNIDTTRYSRVKPGMLVRGIVVTEYGIDAFEIIRYDLTTTA